ncbi:diacylglycerol/lipid kinase family protein [Rhizorhapis sp.]|uniref:diacylglycerol/lipid kinase family protein n=1 Tax=Rhizorhapis sp. TaxID=1968842 RepID=UPI002B4855A9|nr:diacylglycerol kinase family protein [Rhizorhapis sp.]HKR15909.1 diacylglycerol kinase family protein [Rhizorhapis sp.]
MLRKRQNTPPVIQIFANPSAGGFRTKRLVEFQDQLVRCGARVSVSPSMPGATLCVNSATTHIWAFGGDGTARHVAGAAADCGRPISVGIYPAGTVNLLAREMALPYKRTPALTTLDEVNPRQHFLGELNGKIFLTCASAGPDSRIVARLPSRLKRLCGKYAYGVMFLAELLSWRRNPITLTWENGSAECEAFYVAKGRFYAGPWSFAPYASVTDPHLHVVMLPIANRRRYLRFLVALLCNSVERCPGLIRFSCSNLEASAERSVPVQIDGDAVAMLPVKIGVKPNPLTFC